MDDLCASTSGSAGVDVTTVTETVLLDQKVAKNPLNVIGLLGGSLSALLVGRSSTTLQGLFILPGVIDADYDGQIHALAWTPSPPVTIPPGSRIAQLVPFKACVPRASNTERGTSRFGSTGPPELYWTLQITNERPTIKVTLIQAQAKPSEVTLSALVDTGADVTVISHHFWPPSWPTTTIHGGLVGIGGLSTSQQSVNLIQVRTTDGQCANIRPYVAFTPINLLGRDVLSALSVALTTATSPFPQRPLERGQHSASCG